MAVASSYLRHTLELGGEAATLLALCIALGGCRFATALEAREGDVQIRMIKGVHYKTGVTPNTPVLYPFPRLPLLRDLLVHLIFPENTSLQWHQRPKLFQSRRFAISARRMGVGARLLRRWALYHAAAIPSLPFSSRQVVAFAANHSNVDTQRAYIRMVDPIAQTISDHLCDILHNSLPWNSTMTQSIVAAS